MKKFYGSFALFLIIFTTFIFCEGSLDELLDMSLEELMNIPVVTASKSSQKSSDAPATIYTITAAQIKNRGYQSLLDVLQDIPEFKIDRFATTEYHMATVRGLVNAMYFVILLDGAKISPAANENCVIMENYPIHFASQIEIVIGPASALYGADAVSGVINIITKKAENSDKTLVINSNAGMYNTYNTSASYSKSFSENSNILVGGQFFYDKQPNLSDIYKEEFAGIDSLQSGTFNTNWGPMTPQGKVKKEYNIPLYAYSAFAKLTYENFKFSLFKNYSRYPSALSYSPNNAIYNDDVYMAKTATMVNASYSKDFGKINNNTSFTFTTFDLLPESNYRNIYVSLEKGYKYSTSQVSKIEEQIIWNYSEKLIFTGGLSYERLFAIPRSTDLDRKIVEEEGIEANYLGVPIKADLFPTKSSNIGSYIQLQYIHSPKVSFTLGTRYDYNSLYKSTINPRLGVVLHPFDKTNIKLLYGSAFMAPDPNTVFGHYGSFYPDGHGSYFSYYLWVPNTDLKPLKAQIGEMNIQQYVGNALSVTLNAYYTKLVDLFSYKNADQYYNSTDSTYYYHGYKVSLIQCGANLGEEYHYGGSLKFDYLYTYSNYLRIAPSIALIYNEGKADYNDDGNYVETPYISPFSIKASAEINYNKFVFYPSITYMSKQRTREMDTDNKTRKTIDGYTLVNLHTRYNFKNNYSLYLKATNLFNSKYKNVNEYGGSGSPEIKGGSPQNPLRITAGFEINM